MTLNEEQQAAVCDWVRAGASLAEVQKRIKEAFSVQMTYMDVRLLVLELGATVQDKAEPVAKPPVQEHAIADDGMPMDGVPAGVTIDVDRVIAPGAMVSGTVIFSDGVRGTWMIDQMGRFGLDPATPGYKPTPEDVQSFQTQVAAALRQRGMM